MTAKITISTARNTFLEDIRRKLTLGMPPLTLAEQVALYEIAAERKLDRRTRCPACNAEGCTECNGTGYENGVDREEHR